jgi:hypothetical protein
METPTFPSEPSLTLGLKKVFLTVNFNDIKNNANKNGALTGVKLSESEILSILKLYDESLLNILGGLKGRTATATSYFEIWFRGV